VFFDSHSGFFRVHTFTMNTDTTQSEPHKGQKTRFCLRDHASVQFMRQLITLGGCDPAQAEEKAVMAVLHADLLIAELAKNAKPMSERLPKAKPAKK